VAGLNIRPTHISSKEYYSLPVENFRSYPVYMPGREPEGYWEMLQHIGPRPLIEPDTLKTEEFLFPYAQVFSGFSAASFFPAWRRSRFRPFSF
jgi:hypothetical protein